MRQSAHKDIVDFLQKVIPDSKHGHCRQRVEVLSCLIFSCLRKGQSSLEGLSEAPDGQGTQKKSSLIQRAKRWLSNKWTDWQGFYLPFASHFLDRLAASGEIIFVIDGSQTGSAHKTLMISVLCRGFAIPVAWVVKKGELGVFPEQMHLDLLQTVVPLCPAGCRVVLLGDGEFDGQLLLQWCLDQKWEFVLRTSGSRIIDFGGETARFETMRHVRGKIFIPSATPLANAVYWHAQDFKKPLLLLTNMELAEMACLYYKRRFKIETLFKHLKSGGFNLHKTRLKCSIKLAKLIIIVAFAFVFSFCLGIVLINNNKPELLETLATKERLKHIAPITIARLCISSKTTLALNFFSELSKNFQSVFT